MPRPFMRQVVDALLPKGAIWKPAAGGDFDKLLNGVAKNQQAVFDDLGSLEHTRDPYRCPAALLPDLEREFGIIPNNALTEKERRRSLAAVRYKQKALATAQKLQYTLDKAGFGYRGYGLIVTINSPPASPPEAGGCFAMTAHEAPSVYCAGNSRAYSGYNREGFYLNYLISGTISDKKYQLPPEEYWSLIFFIGGPVVRTDSGQITSVATVDIPAIRKQELHRLILRIKPMGVWAAMMVRYM